MENNDSNQKPQQTGGLKLMTVFIAVLALHVVVIGGICAYYMMRGTPDNDLAMDKAHKSVKVASDGALPSDGQLPDATSADKNTTTASTTPAEVKGAPMTIPAQDTTATADSNETTPSATPAPAATAPVSPATTTPSAPVAVMTPPTDASAGTPPSTVQSGPVITPPAMTPAPALSPDASSESASVATPEPETTGGTPYTVKARDSLARIAHRHHITIAKLKEANGLTKDMLRIGQKLVIPAQTQVAATTPAAAPDTGATNLNGSYSAPMEKKKIGTARDEAQATPSAGHHLYTVIKGDTLTKIAHRFRTTTHALMAVNNISDARKMRIGQKLRIPSQESRSAANTPHSPTSQPDRIQPRATPVAQLANFVP